MKLRKSLSFDAVGNPTDPRYLRRSFRSAGSRLLPILLGAGVLFSVLPLVLGDRGIAQLWELGWQEKELRTRLEGLEAEAELLAWEARESGAMAVERPAREKFQMQRPGEIVYYFPREEARPGSDAPTAPDDAATPGGAAESSADPDPKPVDNPEGDR